VVPQLVAIPSAALSLCLCFFFFFFVLIKTLFPLVPFKSAFAPPWKFCVIRRHVRLTRQDLAAPRGKSFTFSIPCSLELATLPAGCG
jgi:hypothetical protein